MEGLMLKDRYKIISLLGEGGMAKVYLAKDEITNREVAVKIIKKETSVDPLNIARFQREAKACASLSHKNVVGIYDVDNYEGRPFMVMEYVKSKSLRDILLNRGYFSVPEAIDIVYQLCDALIHAHKHEVIHRDVKPQNVMVQSDGNIKLADFGIALIKDAPQITQKDFTIGSVHYMAPERARGQTATFKADIYALGVTFFELLSGRPPYIDESAVNIAMKHVKEPFPSIRKLKPEVPKKVEKIINKACSKNPSSRYNSVKDFKSALESCMRVEVEVSGFKFLKKLFKKKGNK